MDNNSQVTLKTFSTSATTTTINLFQSVGSTWHRVQKILGTADFQVETGTAVATVRGTIFGVDIVDGDTEIFVEESQVEVAGLIKQDDQIIKQAATIISPSQQIKLDPKLVADIQASKITRLPTTTISKEKTDRRWHKLNRLRDQELKKRPLPSVEPKDIPSLFKRLELEADDKVATDSAYLYPTNPPRAD